VTTRVRAGRRPAEMAGDAVVSDVVTRMRLGVKPVERRNIVWRALLPHWGNAAAAVTAQY
jgi:hypothetical protein